VFLRSLDPGFNVFALVAVATGGLLQVVYGNLQLHGFTTSFHAGFPLTGSFFNPGPYSGYLGAVFPGSLGIYLYADRLVNDNYRWMVGPLKQLSLATCGGILLVLSAAQSRAAWLGVIVSAFFLLYHWYQWNKYLMRLLDKPVKRAVAIGFCAMFSLALLAGIYLLRKDSADGRVLIWKASWGLVKDNPLFGLGFDRFRGSYMEAQADYLRQYPSDPASALADDVVYAFNEGILLLTEQGLTGLSIFTAVLILCFRINAGKISAGGRIAQAGLLSMLVFGMFSYPSQILPIKLSGVMYLAILTRESDLLFSLKIPQIRTFGLFLFKLSLLLVTVFGGIKLYGFYRALGDWKEAMELYNLGNYETSTGKYRDALPYFGREGEFLINYGKALSVSKQDKDAILILEYAKQYAGNTILQTTLGDSYKALGLYREAEQAYQLAVDMLPDRFYARYLMAKLYSETGQTEKLLPIARYLLEKDPKIPSSAVDEIKAEMNLILRQHLKRTE
jgi:tetratricopeptide (TPR) repeat protein